MNQVCKKVLLILTIRLLNNHHLSGSSANWIKTMVWVGHPPPDKFRKEKAGGIDEGTLFFHAPSTLPSGRFPLLPSRGRLAGACHGPGGEQKSTQRLSWESLPWARRLGHAGPKGKVLTMKWSDVPCLRSFSTVRRFWHLISFSVFHAWVKSYEGFVGFGLHFCMASACVLGTKKRLICRWFGVPPSTKPGADQPEAYLP